MTNSFLFQKVPDCTCDKCKGNCCTPGWWTPAEARRVIHAGYGDFMMLDYIGSGLLGREPDDILVLSPALKGLEGKEAPSLSFSDDGCTFWNEESLCDLHDTDLKPAECRAAHHDKIIPAGHIRSRVANLWKTDEAQQLANEWLYGMAIDEIA